MQPAREPDPRGIRFPDALEPGPWELTLDVAGSRVAGGSVAAAATAFAVDRPPGHPVDRPTACRRPVTTAPGAA